LHPPGCNRSILAKYYLHIGPSYELIFENKVEIACGLEKTGKNGSETGLRG